MSRGLKKMRPRWISWQMAMPTSASIAKEALKNARCSLLDQQSLPLWLLMNSGFSVFAATACSRNETRWAETSAPPVKIMAT